MTYVSCIGKISQTIHSVTFIRSTHICTPWNTTLKKIIWSLLFFSSLLRTSIFISFLSRGLYEIQHIYQWLWKFLNVKPIIVFAWSTSWFVKHYRSETTANRKTYIHLGLLGHNILIKSQQIFEVTPKCCVVSGEVPKNPIVYFMLHPNVLPPFEVSTLTSTHFLNKFIQ